MESKYRLEPISPGIGGPAQGSELKKITDVILSNLDDEIDEWPYEVVQDMELTMPDLEYDAQWLHGFISDMTDVEFWQQKGL